jgi:hypothetical protein
MTWLQDHARRRRLDLADAIRQFNSQYAGEKLLDLFRGRTELTKTSKIHGGEWHGSCPLCGGEDRFMAWPKRGRAWCRKCKASGDALAWAMRMRGLNPTVAGATTRFLMSGGT